MPPRPELSFVKEFIKTRKMRSLQVLLLPHNRSFSRVWATRSLASWRRASGGSAPTGVGRTPWKVSSSEARVTYSSCCSKNTGGEGNYTS